MALSFERWRGITVTYRKAWRDNKDREWQDRGGFGLIDSYNLRDSRRVTQAGEGDGPPTESLSWFRWNGYLFDSFRSGYLKKLDYGIYRSFEQQRPSASTATSTSISSSPTGSGSTSTSGRSPSSTWG